jgi:hypothetical protein
MADPVVRAFNLALGGDDEGLEKMLSEGAVAVSAARSEGMYKGWTLLHAAASKGHVAIVELVLRVGGADLGAVDGKDRTALDLAISKGHTPVVSKLEAAALAAPTAVVSATAALDSLKLDAAAPTKTTPSAAVDEEGVGATEAAFDAFLDTLPEALADRLTDEVAAAADGAARRDTMLRVMAREGGGGGGGGRIGGGAMGGTSSQGKQQKVPASSTGKSSSQLHPKQAPLPPKLSQQQQPEKGRKKGGAGAGAEPNAADAMPSSGLTLADLCAPRGGSGETSRQSAKARGGGGGGGGGGGAGGGGAPAPVEERRRGGSGKVDGNAQAREQQAAEKLPKGRSDEAPGKKRAEERPSRTTKPQAQPPAARSTGSGRTLRERLEARDGGATTAPKGAEDEAAVVGTLLSMCSEAEAKEREEMHELSVL